MAADSPRKPLRLKYPRAAAALVAATLTACGYIYGAGTGSVPSSGASMKAVIGGAADHRHPFTELLQKDVDEQGPNGGGRPVFQSAEARAWLYAPATASSVAWIDGAIDAFRPGKHAHAVAALSIDPDLMTGPQVAVGETVILLTAPLRRYWNAY